MPKSIKISFSSADAYRQCALKHHLAYVERWRTADTPAALARGTAFHSVLETHFSAIRWRDPTEMPSAEFLEILRGHMVEGGLLDGEDADPAVAWMYDGWVSMYGCDDDWEVLATERRFSVPLYDRDGLESEFRLQGCIDLLVRNRTSGKIFAVDFKTCSTLPTAKVLDFDEQTAFYTIAGRRMGFDVYGAIYSAVRSKKLVREMTPEERFSRSLITKTDYELGVVEHELIDTMRDAYRPREFDPPRSPDPSLCSWKCNYSQACLAGRKSGPKRIREFLTDTGFAQPEGTTNPYTNPPEAPPEHDQLDILTALSAGGTRISYDAGL